MNEDLQRVKKKLKDHVVDFFVAHLHGEFTGNELAKWCMERAHCAASSPDRVMRELASDGVLKYTLLSKSDSRYRADFVAAQQLEMFAA